MLLVRAILLFTGIASISYQQEFFTTFSFIGLAILLMIHKEKRFITSLFLSFLMGFLIFMVSNQLIETTNLSKEIKIILNRLFLIFILLGLIINHRIFKKKVSWYNEKPDWNNPIVLPFHTVHMLWVWIIGIIINGMVYLFFIVQRDVGDIQSLLMFCLFFSLINAVFEEVIWRGIMLSALKDFTSTRYAMIVTSFGFGLLHLAIGFSISFSLLISIAGVIYAVLTLKTNSIYPSIVFHLVINIGMYTPDLSSDKRRNKGLRKKKLRP